MKTTTKLFFIITFLLLACKGENSLNYIGEWSSTKKPWPYGAKLKINSDKTFSFFGGACTSSFESFGKWKVENDTLILESDKIADEICHDDFNNNCNEIKFLKPSDPETPTIECDRKFGDNFIIFKNEKFYLKNDTIKHIYKENKCGFRNDFINRCKL